MLIAFIVVLLVLILLSVIGASARKRQEEQARLELTAEHQRIQRENPEHPDAKMGLEEFILSRINELKSIRRRNLGIVLRYGGIGVVGFAILMAIVGATTGFGSESLMSIIIGTAFFGLAIGGIVGSIVVLFKHGRPKLRIKTEP
jgi:Na+/proline symporter